MAKVNVLTQASHIATYIGRKSGNDSRDYIKIPKIVFSLCCSVALAEVDNSALTPHGNSFSDLRRYALQVFRC